MTEQMDEVRFRGSVTRSDWRRAAWLLLRPRPAIAALGVLIACVGALALAVSLWAALRSNGNAPALVLAMWVSMAWSVLATALPYHRSLAAFDRLQPWLAGQDFRASATDVFGRTSFGRLDLPWSFLRSWHEYDDMFVLCFGPGVFAPLPKRFFSSPEDIARFRSVIAPGSGRKAP